MRRAGRRSIMGWLISLPLRLAFDLFWLLVRTVILLRRVVPGSLLLLLLAVVPMITFSLKWLDGPWGWVMLGASLMLAFAAGSARGAR